MERGQTKGQREMLRECIRREGIDMWWVEVFCQQNNKKRGRMSHFCPSLESEHCSKTSPTNTALLPARQSGEEKWLNSHCNPPHPQHLQHSKLSHTLAWGAGQLLCTCAELALTEVTKRDREGGKKIFRKLSYSPVHLPAPVVPQQTLKQPSKMSWRSSDEEILNLLLSDSCCLCACKYLCDHQKTLSCPEEVSVLERTMAPASHHFSLITSSRSLVSVSAPCCHITRASE